MSPAQKTLLFSNKLNVRIDDIHLGNHLSHAKMASLIHNTRALFLQKNNLSEENCFGFGLIMLNLNIEYLGECFFDNLLEIEMYLPKLEKARLELSYSVSNLTTGRIAANATTVMGFFDLEKRKITRMPLEFKEIMGSITIT